MRAEQAATEAREAAEKQAAEEAAAARQRQREEALARLRAAEAKGDAQAVEEELGRGLLPEGVAQEAERRLVAKVDSEKSISRVRKDCAAEVDEAEQALRQAKSLLAQTTREQEAEEAELLEELQRMRDDMEQLQFEVETEQDIHTEANKYSRAAFLEDTGDDYDRRGRGGLGSR